MRLTQDRPGDGYYHSALKAFVTRTCYANSSGPLSLLRSFLSRVLAPPVMLLGTPLPGASMKPTTARERSLARRVCRKGWRWGMARPVVMGDIMVRSLTDGLLRSFAPPGDHLVGWANSSLRLPGELPVLGTPGRGVVCEAPLEDALHASDRLPLSPGRGGEHPAAQAPAAAASSAGRNSKGAGAWSSSAAPLLTTTCT